MFMFNQAFRVLHCKFNCASLNGEIKQDTLQIVSCKIYMMGFSMLMFTRQTLSSVSTYRQPYNQSVERSSVRLLYNCVHEYSKKEIMYFMNYIP